MSACRDGIIRLWNAASFKLIRELKGHKGIVTSVRFSRGGDTLYSVGVDGTARIWDVATGKCRQVLSHERPTAAR